MKCPNCGTENDEGMKFCGECGTPLPQERKCPACGAMVPLKMKFCGECGCRMDGSGAGSAGGGGISMGDKNVVAGDVIGKKEDYSIAGNATIVKNEDESRKVLSCAVCGKHLLNSEAITCVKCGNTVCEDHFNRAKNCCTTCVSSESQTKLDSYKAKLAEAYADGKVDVSERKMLDDLALSLGIDKATTENLESDFKSKLASDTELTRSEKYDFERAKKLLLEEYKPEEAAKIIEPIYERYGNSNIELVSIYLRALKDVDVAKAKQIISSLNVDIVESYVANIDIALGEGNLNDAERFVNAAKRLFPDDVVVKCKEIEYLSGLYKKTDDKSILQEVDAIAKSLPDGKDDYENGCVLFAKAISAQNLGDNSAFGMAKSFYAGSKAYPFKRMLNYIVVAADGSEKFSSIQQAVNAASDGMEIIVKKGCYNETVKINKNVTLVGEGTGADDFPIIYFKPGEYKDDTFVVKVTSPCTLKNLCIQEDAERKGVEYEPRDADGEQALILCMADARFENVTARNSAINGITVLNSSPVITDCDFSYNYGTTFKGSSSNPIVKNTNFHDTKGIGVYIKEGCNGEFTNCKIYGNASSNVYLDGENGVVKPEFKSCSIYGSLKCGVFACKKAEGTFIGCDIYKNSQGDTNNPEVTIASESNPTFKDCQIHDSPKTNGVWIKSSGRGYFDGCKIYGNADVNVELNGKDGVVNPEFKSCSIYGSLRNGVWAHDKAEGTFIDCDISKNSQGDTNNPEVIISSESNPTFKDCQIHDSPKTNGVWIYESGRGCFDGCKIYGNAGSNVYLDGENGVVKPEFKSCSIYGSLTNGVVACDKAEGTFIGCDISKNSQGDKNFPEVLIKTEANPMFKDCQIHDSPKTNGVWIYKSGRGRFDGCQIYGNADANVNLYGKDGVVTPEFKSCSIYGSLREGVFVHDKAEGTFIDCDISKNSQGGKNYTEVEIRAEANPKFQNCQIHHNPKTNGVWIYKSGRGCFDGCQIYGNAKTNVNDETGLAVFKNCKY